MHDADYVQCHGRIRSRSIHRQGRGDRARSRRPVRYRNHPKIDAIYFDGQTTQPHPMTMQNHKGIVAMRGKGIHLNIRLSQLGISERLDHAPRIVRLPNGGFIELSNASGFAAMLAAHGYRDPWVVRWQQNWPLALLALVSLWAILIAGHQWGLPWAADKIAQHLPASIEKI